MKFEEETFSIDTPDELGAYSAELYKSLVAMIPARQGKLVKFSSVAQGKRVTNDMAILAERDKNDVFSEKVRKSQHYRIYLRPQSEAS